MLQKICLFKKNKIKKKSWKIMILSYKLILVIIYDLKLKSEQTPVERNI